MTGDQILFVDDDPNILSAFKRTLHKRFQVVTSLSGEDALNRLEKDGPFAVVVADMQMPGMNGIQFLRKAKDQAPQTVRLMLTGNADQKTAAEAVNEGHVFSFLTKPCPPQSLEVAVSNAVEQYRLIVAEKELLEQTLNGAIKVLTEVLSMTDPVAFGRAEKLREQMKTIAAWFRSPRPWELELAAMLSQIGYVAVPQKVLLKARSKLSLTAAEQDILVRVPQTGAALLQKIPRLGSVAKAVLYQQKNFDGSGYPSDLVSGEAIPIGARILRVLTDLIEVDTLKCSRLEAFQIMRQTKGRYDPKVLEAVAASFDVYLDKVEPVAPAPVAAPLADIVIGDTLAQDVQTADGTLLVTANTQITAPLLEKLKNFADLTGLKGPILIASRKKPAIDLATR
jgi:response regulator RpfG family c-di-GMP phosphodiesterase